VIMMRRSQGEKQDALKSPMVAPPIASAGEPMKPARKRIASSVWIFCKAASAETQLERASDLHSRR